MRVGPRWVRSGDGKDDRTPILWAFGLVAESADGSRSHVIGAQVRQQERRDVAGCAADGTGEGRNEVFQRSIAGGSLPVPQPATGGGRVQCDGSGVEAGSSIDEALGLQAVDQPDGAGVAHPQDVGEVPDGRAAVLDDHVECRTLSAGEGADIGFGRVELVDDRHGECSQDVGVPTHARSIHARRICSLVWLSCV